MRLTSVDVGYLHFEISKTKPENCLPLSFSFFPNGKLYFIYSLTFIRANIPRLKIFIWQLDNSKLQVKLYDIRAFCLTIYVGISGGITLIDDPVS